VKLPSKAKVVAAYLDGRRLKGYTNDFSPARDQFFLFPEDAGSGAGERGIPIRMADLKALFFVKGFAGDPTHLAASGAVQPGKKIEVTFPDGETLMGFSVAYNPKGVGFFLQPADSTGNNERIFVVNRNAKQVRVV
jgi:uncharacterized protein DUF6982